VYMYMYMHHGEPETIKYESVHGPRACDSMAFR